MAHAGRRKQSQRAARAERPSQRQKEANMQRTFAPVLLGALVMLVVLLALGAMMADAVGI